MSAIKIDVFCPVGIGGTKGINTHKLKLFVGGLSQKHSSKDLYDIFIDFGAIRESVVIPDRFRVRSRCYGFVTFANESSVKKVLASLPILAFDNSKLTVVLASSNTKPRRAHFSVKHGISGHKPLPNAHSVNNNHKNNKKNKNGKNKPIQNDKKISIYTDPSLFRTANIQQIAPAQFKINDRNNNNKQKKQIERMNWPNDDIKKDYHNLKKVSVFSDHKRYKHGKISKCKSWKLISIKKEPEKQSYLQTKNQCHENDEIHSVKSGEWKTIKNNQRKVGKTSTKKEVKKEIEEIECDKLTFRSSIFDGFYDNKTEMEELKNMFKKRMQTKINPNPIPNNNHLNGTWSPYQPIFTTNLQNYGIFHEYNFQNMAPTPPIQPIIVINNNNNNNISNGKGVICENNKSNMTDMNVINYEYGYNNNNYYNEQMNLYYNYANNYVYNAVHSVENGK